jgi:ribonuclease D
LKTVTIVDRPEVLADAVLVLQNSTRVGVDTESNGFHSYLERVCLIQISTAKCDFIIDPLAIPDVSPLGPVFASDSIQKVFHGGDYDIVCMKRDFGFSFANVFDTVVACKLLEGQEVALSKLLVRHFGIELDKSLQRSDWGRRPLSIQQLEYAVLDSRYLLPLAEILKSLLTKSELMGPAELLFQRLCDRAWTGTAFDPEGYRRIKGYSQLDPKGKGVLRQLYELRDRWARRMDRPPFKVIGNLGLLNLAQQRPETAESLARSKGFPKRPDVELLDEVLRVLSSAPAEPEPPLKASAPSKRRRRRRRQRRAAPID